MRIALVTNCTNRKTLAPARGCVAASLRSKSLAAFAREWRRNIDAAHPRHAASDLYMGRGFLEARRAWESTRERFQTDLYIASAGLGLVSAAYRAPAYSITVSGAGPDSVVRLLGLKGPADWWSALTTGRRGLLSRFDQADLVVVALSSAYLDLLRDELCDLADGSLARLRLITRRDPSHINPRLRRAWMAYDNRLNGRKSPIPGAESDFTQRALRHFSEEILCAHPRAGAAAHAGLVEAALAPLSRPRRHQRKRVSDEELKTIMRRIGPDIGAARMLRVLRDENNIACEQSRCRALYKEAFAKTRSGRTAA